MMTAEQLKGSILQLAMQGKLVEQRPEEGTGEELYKEIRANSKRLGTKKSKVEINNEEEFPYEIPDSWLWVKLSDIVSLTSGKKYEECSSGSLYIKVAEMNLPGNEEEITLSDKYVSENNKGIIPINSIIFPKRGGAIATNKKRNVLRQPVYIDSNTMAITVAIPSIFPYIRKWFDSIDLGKLQSGSAVPQINNQDLEPLFVPLPPLAEQKRIIAKIEELMPFVEQYETASTKLNTLNTTFPEMMKKSILQEAVQAKLVPQDPNDEPASVLLKKITEEKNRLIKEGKIKKQKPLPEISEDEIPFDIPESWEWVRLGTILTLLTDGTHKTPHYVEEGIPFISVKDMSSGKISFSNTKFITEKEADEINMRCNPQRGDILLSKVGTTGVPAPVDTDIKFSLFVSVALLKFNNDFINREYLINVICSPCVQKQCAENTRGVGNKNWVMRDIANTLIPIAPLREQESIVSELKRIIPSFASLEQRIH